MTDADANTNDDAPQGDEHQAEPSREVPPSAKPLTSEGDKSPLDPDASPDVPDSPTAAAVQTATTGKANVRVETAKSRGWLGDAIARVKKNKMAVTCFWIVVLVFLSSSLYSLPHLLVIDTRPITPEEEIHEFGFSDEWEGFRWRVVVNNDSLPVFFQDYVHQDVEARSEPPSTAHWFGTDSLGRDLFARTLFGGFISFLVGICATMVAAVIGVVYGAVAGYVGGQIDNIMMRFVDILYALPFLLVIILLRVMIDDVRKQQGWSEWVMFGALFVLLGAYAWLTMARVTRGQVLAAKHSDYVAAAIAAGAKPRRVLFRHLLPNVLGPVIIYVTLSVPQVILLESFLSFLGLGISAPHTSWGALVNDGRAEIYPGVNAPWVLIAPAAVMTITLLALNFLGDGIRDAMDPRMR